MVRVTKRMIVIGIQLHIVIIGVYIGIARNA
jgi:hypothetical protein